MVRAPLARLELAICACSKNYIAICSHLRRSDIAALRLCGPRLYHFHACRLEPFIAFTIRGSCATMCPCGECFNKSSSPLRDRQRLDKQLHEHGGFHPYYLMANGPCFYNLDGIVTVVSECSAHTDEALTLLLLKRIFPSESDSGSEEAGKPAKVARNFGF